MAEWFESEWSENGLSAYEGGVEVDVYALIGNDDLLLPWAWSVKATDAVTECPELFDCGTCATPEEAKRAAEAALERAVVHYADSYQERLSRYN